jgi:hypothetical protein
MKRNAVTVIVTVALLGCGGSPPSPVPNGFVNQTRHSEAELRAIWAEAQQSVAQQIDLNPVAATLCQRVPRNAARRSARLISFW